MSTLRILTFFVSGLIIGALIGCVSQPQEYIQTLPPHTPPSIAEVEYDYFVSPHDGLTVSGCTYFFPQYDGATCLAKWRRLSPIEKLSVLQNDSPPLARGMWVVIRNNALVKLIISEYPNDAFAKAFLILSKLTDVNALYCANLGQIHEDECLLLMGRIASDEEAQKARVYITDQKNWS